MLPAVRPGYLQEHSIQVHICVNVEAAACSSLQTKQRDTQSLGDCTRLALMGLLKADWALCGCAGHGWLPQLPPAGHRFYPSQLLSAPAQQQAASRALPHRADDSFAGRPGPANSPLQLFTTHLDPQAHHPDSARGNSSFTNTWLSFSDCEQPVNSTSSRGSPLVAQDAEPQESAWEPQVFLSEPGLGQLADQRGSAGQPEGSGTDPPALEAVAVAVSLVGDIPEWPLEGPAAELPAAGSSGPFNAPGWHFMRWRECVAL